jgi:hypothetical protein
MGNVLLSAIEFSMEIPGGTSDSSLLVMNVEPYREIRGFFGKRSGPEITLTLQILNPKSPEDKPSATNGTVIGVLDQFTLEGDFPRSYSVPGLWLQVLASIGPGGGARMAGWLSSAWAERLVDRRPIRPSFAGTSEAGETGLEPGSSSKGRPQCMVAGRRSL